MTDLLKPSEVGRMLQVSRTWLYDAAKDGRIPSVRLGGPDGPVRFVEQDIEQWLERARRAWRPGESSAQTLRRARRADRRGHAGSHHHQPVKHRSCSEISRRRR